MDILSIIIIGVIILAVFGCISDYLENKKQEKYNHKLNEIAEQVLDNFDFEEERKEVLKTIKNTISDKFICPKCGNILRYINGRYGEFVGCHGYPECRYTRKKIQ